MLRRDILATLGDDVSADFVVQLVASHEPEFSVFREELETGEFDEDTYPRRMLVKFSGMVIDAKMDDDQEGIYKWAYWCSSFALDLSQQLGDSDVRVDIPEDAGLIIPPDSSSGMQGFEAFEFATQVRILEILESGEPDALRKVSSISTAIRDALIPVWQEEFR